MLAATMVASLAACGSKKTEEATSTVHKDITAAQYDGTVTSDAEIYRKGFTMPEFRGMEVTVDKSVLNVSDEDVDDYINQNIVAIQESLTAKHFQAEQQQMLLILLVQVTL